VIVDIDHQDAWTIEPRDINAKVIASAVVHLGTTNANAGDGIATPWSLTTTSAIIYSIRIRFTGSSQTPGLAFDNFSPANALPAPAPARLGLRVQPTAVSLTITGTPSALYRIEQATTIPSRNWTTLTNIYLPSSSFTLFDPRSTNTAAAIYRAVGIQR
jgi:hypothetical protein